MLTQTERLNRFDLWSLECWLDRMPWNLLNATMKMNGMPSLETFKHEVEWLVKAYQEDHPELMVTPDMVTTITAVPAPAADDARADGDTDGAR